MSPEPEKRSDEETWAALADAATPGPWVLDSHAHGASRCRCMSCYQTSTVWQPGGRFCDDVPRDENDPDDDGDRCDQFGYSYEDGAFIAASRTAVPSLLAALAASRADNDQLRADVMRISNAWADVIQREQRTDNAAAFDIAEANAERDAARVEVSQLRAKIERVEAAHAEYHPECAEHDERFNLTGIHACRFRAALAGPLGSTPDQPATEEKP